MKFNFFKNKSPPLIGVDISATSIKMVELSSDGDGHYHLDAYAISPIAKQAMADGNVADLETVAHAISMAWATGQPAKTRRFGLA